MPLYTPIRSSEEDAVEFSSSGKIEDTDRLLRDKKTEKSPNVSIALAVKHMPWCLKKWIYGLCFGSIFLFIVNSTLFAILWWVSLRDIDSFCFKHSSYYSM